MSSSYLAKSPAPVVSIIGGSIWGNRGAAAMLETTIGILREFLPEARFNIFTPYPAKDRKLVSDEHFRFFDSRPLALISHVPGALWGWVSRKLGLRSRLPQPVQAIAESAVLLDIGGITFADGRLIFLPYNILTIWPAMLLGTPVVKMSQAAGSFHNPVIRLCAKIFLPRCQHIFSRGEQTHGFLRELGLAENMLTPAADAAFLYKPEYCLTAENCAAVQQVCHKLDAQKKQGAVIIAISPSVLVMEKSEASQINYSLLLLDLIKHTSTQNTHFIVFPNASRERSKKTRNNDIRAIERMRAEAELSLPQPFYERITWITYDLNTQGIEEVMRYADVLITSRFHAMVFGLRLNVPTLVIGWGHKYQETLAEFGIERYATDFSHASDHILTLLDELIRDKEIIRSRLKEYLPSVQESARRQFSYLQKWLAHG